MRAIGRYIRQQHLGIIALVIALSGTAWAAVKIGPNDIQANAVRSKHIAKGQVQPQHLAKAQVVKIKPNPKTATDPCDQGKAGVFCGTANEFNARIYFAMGPPWAPVTVSLDASGVVRFQGAVGTGPPGPISIFILPKKFRPKGVMEFVVPRETAGDTCGASEPRSICESRVEIVQVMPNGRVWNKEGYSGATEGLTLDGISYRI